METEHQKRIIDDSLPTSINDLLRVLNFMMKIEQQKGVL